MTPSLPPILNSSINSAALDKIVGQSKAIINIKHIILKVAPTFAPVLIQGESGTGKELIAKALHAHSKHNNGPFIPVNCSAIPLNLIESELFGHVQGAFTGAHKDKKGLALAAQDGTLFLDEIADLPLSAQSTLLRFLEEKEVKPVGSAFTLHSNARIVAASAKPLLELVEQKLFREDLYFRLQALEIINPPLRQKPEDIELLIEALTASIVKKHNLSSRISADLFPKDTLHQLKTYHWPGNIRELHNCLERLLILHEPPFSINTLPSHIQRQKQVALKLDSQQNNEDDFETIYKNLSSLKEHNHYFEQKYIQWALKQHNNNKTHAAKALGISLRSLMYKIEP